MERRAKAFVAHNTDRLNSHPLSKFVALAACGGRCRVSALAASACKAGLALHRPVLNQANGRLGRRGGKKTIAFGTAIERLIKRRSRDDAIRVLKNFCRRQARARHGARDPRDRSRPV